MSSDLETQIVAVERVEEYASLPREPASPPAAIARREPLPADWPATGAIRVRGLKLRYRVDTPYVLHGVDLDIRGGERIGVVGRTGASWPPLPRVRAAHSAAVATCSLHFRTL